MILDTKEAKCTWEVLCALNRSNAHYSDLYKSCRVSHVTLQTVLKGLASKKFIKKHDNGHMNVEYEILDKGKTLLEKLRELKKVLDSS